ncbi:MAG: LiaI-LiaF-like domain-containing protein [Anaerolineae bacterium]
MHARSGAAFWALVLIAIGAIFLLQNLNILSGNVWGTIWPVFLILLGGWLLLGNFTRRSSGATTVQPIPLDGARQAHLAVHQGAGRLNLGPSSDPATLVSNTVDSDLEQTVRREGDRLDVTLRQERDWTFWMWPWNWGSGLHWTMNVNREVPLSLDLHTGASQANIDLRDLKVNSLKLDIGASTVDLTLPAIGHVTGRIKAGAATVRIRVPDGVAARIRASLGAATLNVRGTRFPWQGGMYQSPDYDTAANRVDLDIDAGASTIDVT